MSKFAFKPPRYEADNVRVECIIFCKKTKKKYGFSNNLTVISQSGLVVDEIRANK